MNPWDNVVLSNWERENLTEMTFALNYGDVKENFKVIVDWLEEQGENTRFDSWVDGESYEITITCFKEKDEEALEEVRKRKWEANQQWEKDKLRDEKILYEKLKAKFGVKEKLEDLL